MNFLQNIFRRYQRPAFVRPLRRSGEMKQVRQLLQRVNASPKLSNEILENIQPTKEGKTDLGYFYHPQFSLIAVSRIRNSHDILNDLKNELYETGRFKSQSYPAFGMTQFIHDSKDSNCLGIYPSFIEGKTEWHGMLGHDRYSLDQALLLLQRLPEGFGNADYVLVSANLSHKGLLLRKCFHIVKKALSRAILNDGSETVRLLETKNLTDSKKLSQVALSDQSVAVRQLAVEKLGDQQVLYQIAIKDSSYELSKMAVERLVNQQILSQVATESRWNEVKELAIERISDQKALYQLVSLPEPTTTDSAIRFGKLAMKKLNDQELLSKVALDDAISVKMREEAINKLNNQVMLKQIAMSELDPFILGLLAEKLSDQKTLVSLEKRLAETSYPHDKRYSALYARCRAIEKILDQSMLAEWARHHEWSIRLAAMNNLTNQTVLVNIVNTDENESVREAAIKNLTDQNILVKVAKCDDEDVHVRAAATEKVTDQKVLFELAKSIPHGRLIMDPLAIAKAAIKNLTDQGILAKLARHSESSGVRSAAEKRLSELKAN